MKTSESISLLAAALAKAQGEMKPALKDKPNPAFKGAMFANLASAWEAAQEPLSRYGLSVVQAFEPGEDRSATRMITRLMHSSGEWIESTLTMYPVDSRPQTLGSAITYNRRYSLMAILGVVPDDIPTPEHDDDGNLASGTPVPKKPVKQQQLPQAAEVIPAPPPPFDPKNPDHLDGFKWLMQNRFENLPTTLWNSLAASCKGFPATDDDLEKAVRKILAAKQANNVGPA